MISNKPLFLPPNVISLTQSCISILSFLAVTLFTLAFPPWIFGKVDGVPILELEAWIMHGLSAIFPDEVIIQNPLLPHPAAAGSGFRTSFNQKVSYVWMVALEAVRKLLFQLIWVFQREVMLASFEVAYEFVKVFPFLLARHLCEILLYTGQNIEVLVISSVIGTYGMLVHSSRNKKANNQCTAYILSWLDIVWAGTIRVPFILGALSLILRNIRRDLSQMIAGGALYTAVVGILYFICSRLPLQYALCLASSWSAILVLSAVFLRAPARF